jgi:hypothetical protein
LARCLLTASVVVGFSHSGCTGTPTGSRVLQTDTFGVDDDSASVTLSRFFPPEVLRELINAHLAAVDAGVKKKRARTLVRSDCVYVRVPL